MGFAKPSSRPGRAFDVLLAEPDATRRADLAARVSASHSSRLLAAVATLSEVYHIAEHATPDLVVVDSRLALLEEFDVLAALFQGLAIRCVLASWNGMPCERVAFMARHHKLAVLDAHLPPTGLDSVFDRLFKTTPAADGGKPHTKDKGENPVRFNPKRRILIGSSTGGVDALITVLSRFPANCPPTLIVQHTGADFAAGLARLLNQHTQAQLQLANPQTRLKPGHIYLAPGGDTHLVLRGATGQDCALVGGPPVSGHRPSVDALFRSARSIASNVSAALLTGMGADGAKGLAELRAARATTIGQDEASSVVYGMPRVAMELGAVEQQLPLSRIGPRLLQSCLLQEG